MGKKLLMVFGLASTLALALAFATEKPDAGAAGVASTREAEKAAIEVEGTAGKAYDCRKAESHCLKKKSAAAGIQPSDDQNVASSGIDCPKSADCPKADCDKSMCLKPHGKAKAEPAGKAEGKSPAETEI